MVAPSQAKRTILIVEDEDVMRKVLADNLQAEGFEIIEAATGEDGLEKSRHYRPDLILLDNRMPGMSGFAMLKRLRETNEWGEQVPVIFFSNIEPRSQEERNDISSVGASFYMLKVDTSIDELITKIRELLPEQTST